MMKRAFRHVPDLWHVSDLWNPASRLRPASARSRRGALRARRRIAGFAIFVLLCASSLIAQFGAQRGEWRSYGGDEASTGYSPLDQINRDNVKELKIAWAWKSDNFGSAEFKNESTPLMVKGVLYFTAGDRRAVVAVD